MKNILLIIGFIASLQTLKSQDKENWKPDYDSIKQEISDGSSKYYYPKLLERCSEWDTSLTFVDYRYLYFGYTFQPQYDPYWRSPNEDKLVAYYRKPDFTKKDYDIYITLANASLDACPFDLRTLNFLAYVYELKGDEQTAHKMRYKFSMILTAILSTGDGQSCQTGFHVISTSHEYFFLNMFEFSFTQQTLTKDLCDYMSVEKDQRGIDGIYFNISRLWNVNIEKMKKD